MPGSSESSHPHNLAGKYLHTRTAPTSHHSQRISSTQVRELVKQTMIHWRIPQVSLTELWGNIDVAGACAGSKRYLVGCLGGYGNVDPIEPAGEFQVVGEGGASTLVVKWAGYTPQQPPVEAQSSEWGRDATGVQVPGQGGW